MTKKGTPRVLRRDGTTRKNPEKFDGNSLINNDKTMISHELSKFIIVRSPLMNYSNILLIFIERFTKQLKDRTLHFQT